MAVLYARCCMGCTDSGSSCLASIPLVCNALVMTLKKERSGMLLTCIRLSLLSISSALGTDHVATYSC